MAVTPFTPLNMHHIPTKTFLHTFTSQSKNQTLTTNIILTNLFFDDDKLLTGEKRKALENCGGSGVLKVLIAGDLQIAIHNIILGLNIPNYPTKK